MTSPETLRADLRAYILREMIRDAAYPLADDETFLAHGLADSLALAELAVFVEDRYGVYIPDPELTVARMGTLDQIVARVQAGLSAR
jgi:acyl carrier protein